MDPDWYLDHVLAGVEPDDRAGATSGPVRAWRLWWRQRAGVDDPALRRSVRQGFVLAPRDVTELGQTRQRARTLVRRGTWTAAGFGAVAPLDVRDGPVFEVRRRRHALLGSAAVLRRPRLVLSCRTAAVAHGLPTLTVPGAPQTTDPRPTGLGRRGPGHVHGARLRPRDLTRWFGVPLTTTGRTLVDLARHDRRDAVMAVDAALRESLVTWAELRAALDDAIGWPGVRQARDVLALGDPAAESPLESLTRLALHDSGFPAPALQAQIGRYRVDLLIGESRLVIEADGRSKYTGDELWREKRREHALRALGYRVERVVWSDVVRDWAVTSRRLRASMRRPPADGG